MYLIVGVKWVVISVLVKDGVDFICVMGVNDD